jgi:hypothetical protein
VPFGAEEDSSVLVVLEVAGRSGDDTPEEAFWGALSDLVRSTAMSFAGAIFTGSCEAFLESTGFSTSVVVASTSSAQLVLGASSENVPVAGVAVPEVALLESVCEGVVDARPLAACA